MRTLRNLALCVLILTAVACGSNPHSPRGNSVGEDRIDEFNKAAQWVLAHSKDGKLTEGMPDSMGPRGVLSVHVGKAKVVAFEFPSEPIDSNPIYIFVDPSVSEPQKVVEDFCRENHPWQHLKKLDEPGWYLAYGL